MKTFEEVWAKRCDGWLSEPEAWLLWSTAKDCQGTILEVGCYTGRSTCLLAELERDMIVVDPFGDFGLPNTTGDQALERWIANVLALDALLHKNDDRSRQWLTRERLADDERPVQTICLERRRVEDLQLDQESGFDTCYFAYLDGDHTRKGTLWQIFKALDAGATTIAVHDVNDVGGGAEVKGACLDLLGPWTDKVESLAVWKGVKV